MSELWRQLRRLVDRHRFDRDLAEEMQSHRDMQADDYEACGMPPAEARQAARRQFGNVTLAGEDSRAVWAWRWLEGLARDVRFTVRATRRAPLFAAVVVLTLGLGIGGNTLMFSLLEAVALRPLAYADPARLCDLATAEPHSRRAMNSSYPDFRDWQRQSRVFQTMAAYNQCDFSLTGPPEPERVDALCTTPELFQLLGVHTMAGRAFEAGEQGQVALLGHALWTGRFGGDPAIVGRGIVLDGKAYTVVGVLPAGFHFPPLRYSGDPQVFVPLDPQVDRTAWYLHVIGRLSPGATIEQARAEMNAVAARLAAIYPAERGQGIVVQPFGAGMHFATTALLLLGAVGFVLMIACANVANLILSQGAARRREFAIRISVGAGRGRLIRQLLTESLLLAGCGAAVGVVFAKLGLPVLQAIAPERSWSYTRQELSRMRLDHAVLLFTAAVALAAGVLSAILPAFRTSNPARWLARNAGLGRVRGALMAVEVGLSFVLLAGAGLMVNSMWRLLAVDPGFETGHLLTMSVELPESKYPGPVWGRDFFARVLPQLDSIPGVDSAAAIDDLPLTRSWSLNGFEIEDRAHEQGTALFHRISSAYFRVMGIPLLYGREFTAADSERASAAGIVNHAMAAKYWPHDTPLGKAIIVECAYTVPVKGGHQLRIAHQRVEIVGVVGDVRQIGRDVAPRPELFRPYLQWPPDGMSIIVRTAANPVSLIPAVRRQIWRVDPDLPVTDIKTMRQWVAADLADRRFLLLLIGAFALAAATLAAVGIFGMASYAVRQRTQEIGIRMALGARQRDVIGLVLHQSALWLLAGLGAGVAAATVLTRLLTSHLFAVQPGDPATLLLAALALASIALLSQAGPARRAAGTDPATVLRHD